MGGGLGGFVSNLMGTNDTTKYTAESAGLQNPFTAQDVKNQAYGANQALAQSNYLQQALNNQGGLGNQQTAMQMLLAQANGTGPNPALAQLNQATQANTANQAALMAGQRGTGANAGLIARQAGMQGAANQQNAIGQAATLAAQQQMAGQQNYANAANQQVQNMLAGTNAFNQNAQGMLGQVQGGVNAQNANMMGLQQLNAGTNARNQAMNQMWASKALDAGAQAAMMGLGAPSAPKPVGGFQAGGAADAFESNPMFQHAAHGGQIKPIGNIGPKSQFAQACMNMQAGGHVPGKASVPGDSYANDTVPAMLSPGEVVIPRHIMQGKNAPEAAAKFVAAIMAKKGK